MDWVVNEVKDKGLLVSLIIIYCRSLRSVAGYVKAELDEDAWVDRDQDQPSDRNVPQ